MRGAIREPAVTSFCPRAFHLNFPLHLPESYVTLGVFFAVSRARTPRTWQLGGKLTFTADHNSAHLKNGAIKLGPQQLPIKVAMTQAQTIS